MTGDRQRMREALDLARQADYGTSPNPMVGAVIVDGRGLVVGRGYHLRAFEPHAERVALAAAGERARGGTLYVNLEPCAHHGRTPPCAEAIVAAGVRRVVAATIDPNPLVNGKGVGELRAAGVDVEVGVEEEPARSLNTFYLKWMTTGWPFVTSKFAMSLDGKIATTTGESRWISGEDSRDYAHRLRHAHDAIVVGINTVLTDDPELTTRTGAAHARHPLRVVLDSNLRTPLSARLLQAGLPGRTLIVGREGADAERVRALEATGAEVLLLPTCGERVDLPALLTALGRRQLISLLVEGGGEVHASFLEGGLVDRVEAVVAALLIGGRSAATPVGGAGFERLGDAVRLDEVEVTRLGVDVLVRGRVHRHS